MKRTWYLWAKNDHPRTNAYLAKIIGEQYPENEHRDQLCSDGVRRNLWCCPQGYQNVRSAIAAIDEHRLDFVVFTKPEGGKIVPYLLWRKEYLQKARRNYNKWRIRHHMAPVRPYLP